MRVVSSFSRARSAGANLDRAVATQDFVALFDGNTPKETDGQTEYSLTRDLVDSLDQCVKELPRTADVPQILNLLTESVSHLATSFRPSAAGCVYSSFLRSVIVVGDVWVQVDDEATFYNHKFEAILTDVRRAVTQEALARGCSVENLRRSDPGRETIMPLLEYEKNLRNVPADGEYFFAGFDGRPIPRSLVAEVKVPLSARRLTLASDGYPILGLTLEECEKALAQEVRDDPLRIGPRGGTKAVPIGGDGYDDRTRVAVDLNGSDSLQP